VEGGTTVDRQTHESLPAPVAHFALTPLEPSVLDLVRFFDTSADPASVGITAWSYDFGDGASAAGRLARHRYAADGDYTVAHTVTTVDGRTATTAVVVHVRTHDVSIATLTAPQSASAGETLTISVSLNDTHYPETVQVQLLKRGGLDDWTAVGGLTQAIPPATGHGTAFAFTYTFTSDDARAGEVTFRAVAAILGVRDSYPGDNDVTARPTKVT
jgi:PKD repeat protein